MPTPPSDTGAAAGTDRQDKVGADSHRRPDDPSPKVPPPPVGGGQGEGETPPPGYPPPPPGYYPYPPVGYPPWEEDEIDLREYWRVLVRHRRMIFTTTLAAGLLAALVRFIIPKTYTATARILPPKGGRAGQLGPVVALAVAPPSNIPSMPTAR